MRSTIVFAAAGMLLMMCTGCATMMTGSGREQAVRISSHPQGADVIVDGHHRGITPTSVRLTRGDHHNVRIEKAGYESVERDLRPGLNGWVWGNLFFGGLIGLGIDYVSGASAALKPGALDAKLVPVQSPTAPAAGVSTSPSGPAGRAAERTERRRAARASSDR